MAKPELSWFPISFARQIIADKSITTEDLLYKAKELGFKGVDLYYQFLGTQDHASVDKVGRLARELGLEIPMYVCSPDYTNPDPEVRRQQQTLMEMYIDSAHLLGVPMVRVTAGQNHPDTDTEQGLAWIVDRVLELGGFASILRIRVAIENHYKDPFAWKMEDFTTRKEAFFNAYDEWEDNPIVVNFNCATPTITGDDTMEILRRVKKDVAHVHAADWSKDKGGYVAAGDGDVPFDDIFSELAKDGFSGYIAVSGGVEMSEDDVRRSKDYLQMLIDKHWAG